MNDDLISRSALAAEIQSMSISISGEDVLSQEAKDSVLAHIATQPTIDAVPVVHGRWIEDDETQTCSNCGEEHEWGDYRASYCDTCGAKMDGQTNI